MTHSHTCADAWCVFEHAALKTDTHTCHYLTTGHLDGVPETPAAGNHLTTNRSPEEEEEEARERRHERKDEEEEEGGWRKKRDEGWQKIFSLKLTNCSNVENLLRCVCVHRLRVPVM